MHKLTFLLRVKMATRLYKRHY